MKHLLPFVILMLLAGPAHAVAPADPVTTVEVTPSTQPATTEEGVVVQPPPTIKVTSPAAPGKDPWGVTDIIIGIAAILGVVSAVLFPVITKVLKELGDIRATAAAAFAKQQEQEKRQDRLADRQDKVMLATDPNKLPPHG